MKKTAKRLMISLFFLYTLACPALAADYLIPVGKVIGLDLKGDAVTVSALDDALPAAKEAGIRIGDEILSIDGSAIDSAADIRRALNRSDGTVEMVVSREGKEESLQVKPHITAEGPRLGIYLRQGITGIGTVTYYDPDTGAFGTLGHGVSDAQGNLLQVREGSAYPAHILSIDRGRVGDPGQLRGSLDSERLLGSISGNTAQGVFGTASNAWEGEAIPVAAWSEIKTGPATIRSTVDNGAPRDYSVEILKIYPKSRPDGRNFLLKVTDSALLQTTGGIVQGMSGSPIIQDGKLVGAVTHVLVNSPETGYGIFIENMLDAAS
ncbi:MAG: PDZ domain-containing protein [Oscillospiraceae bacterium]|nr:PDZ domain-containing protein [Oscillospiraceae bacterium]